MRRRVLASTLAVALASIVLLCVPLGLVADSLISQDFNHRLDRDLQNVSASLADLAVRGQPVSASELANLVPSGRHATFTPNVGPPISVGDITGATRSESVTVATGRLTMQAPLSVLHGRIRDIWLLIVGLGLLTLILATGLSLWLAARLNRPLHALAATAERLGRGDLRPARGRYGIAELDTLAEVLERSGARIGRMIDDERRFVREASHQLRTPLTSLTVRLEEVRSRLRDDRVLEEITAALDHIDRLGEVVSATLAWRGSPAPSPRPIDVTAMLDVQQREWCPAYRRSGRDLLVDATPGLTAWATPGAIEQAIATLIENAMVHGAGTTTLRARGLHSYVRITVADEGPGVPDALLGTVFTPEVSGADRSGLGLALARSLVESDSGRLELTRSSPAEFTIYLPSGPGSG